MNKQQTTNGNASSAAATSLLRFYSPAPGEAQEDEFALAKQRLIYELRETMDALENLSLDGFRVLALRSQPQAPLTPSTPSIGDFLNAAGKGSLYAKDGRKIRGTVEVKEATGILTGAYRDKDGHIRWEDVDVDSTGCDYDTKSDGAGQVFFEADTGPHVHEADVVLVSKSRLSEFLAAVAEQSPKAEKPRRTKRV